MPHLGCPVMKCFYENESERIILERTCEVPNLQSDIPSPNLAEMECDSRYNVFTPLSISR